MEFEGKANQILISTEAETLEVSESVKNCLTPADAGLQLKKIKLQSLLCMTLELVYYYAVTERYM